MLKTLVRFFAVTTLTFSFACGDDGDTKPGGEDWSIADAEEMVRTGGDQNLEADYAGKYRDDLANHPGCVPRTAYGPNTSEPFSTDNGATVPAGEPATIADYSCAAKEYTQANEDTSKPIIILVHGNSSGVTSFEEYEGAVWDETDEVWVPYLAGTETTTFSNFTFTIESTVREQLATKLLALGHRVIGYDARVDLVATLGDYFYENDQGNLDTENPFMNIDHGWNVPMLQSLIKAVMTNNPSRKVSLVGHSLGVTSIRDALRRLYIEHKDGAAGAVNPFAQLKDVILLSGANHGVSTYEGYCGVFAGMRGTVACEMGDRSAFVPTYFTKPLNGPGDAYSTPCADGSFAFGEEDQCSGNAVQYTTITMEDVVNGALQDEFVSEASAALGTEYASNETIGLGDFDASGYFFTNIPGALANHFGSARADAGMQLILQKLAD